MPRRCRTYGCGKGARFGVPGEKASHCGSHKEDGEIDVVSKLCETPSCSKHPSFGQPGEPKRRCAEHKIHGDVGTKRDSCTVPGCPKRPSYAPPGEIAKRCSPHRIEGDIDVAHMRICVALGCNKNASCGLPGDKPVHCSPHKEPGEVNVVTTRCQHPGCPIIPSFAQPGENKKRCAKHRISGDVNVVNETCEVPGCPRQSSFAQPGESKKRCSGHRLEGDSDVVHTPCEVPGCPILPTFAQPGETKKRCYGHRHEGDVDVASMRCSSESCMFYENVYIRGIATYFNPETGMKDMCYTCHRTKYPQMHKRVTVSKEIFVLAEIQRQIPELQPYFLVWDCKLNLQDCSKDKPDMAWAVKDTLIHVEIDEDGKGHEDNTERIVGIHAASNLLNHKLIRFNPDKSSDGSKSCFLETQLSNGDRAYKRNLPIWNQRIPVLVQNVREAFNDALENVNVTTGKRKLFF